MTAAFPRHNRRKFKYYERDQIETRYLDTVCEIKAVLIIVAMVNL